MAASASLLGLDGWAMLTAEDPLERLVREALRQKADELTADVDETRSNRIARAVGRLFK